MPRRSSIEIAQDTKMRPISDVATELGLGPDDFTLWGDYKAKVKLGVMKRLSGRKDGALVLVTTMNPTPKATQTSTSLKRLPTSSSPARTFLSVACVKKPSPKPVVK